MNLTTILGKRKRCTKLDSEDGGRDAHHRQEAGATVRVPAGRPIAGQVFAAGDPVVVNTDAEGGADPEGHDSRFFASVPMISAPLSTADEIVGLLNLTERIGRSPFEPRDFEYIEPIGKVAGTARKNACESIEVGLAKLAEYRDTDTELHLERVSRFCRTLAEGLRENSEFRSEIDEEFLENLDRSVPLHDIGKVAIPDHILLCPGRLTAEQMAIMRTHAAIGAKTIRSLIERSPDVGYLAMAADIAHYHHEWYDGSGYPEGLKANEIPLSARITAIGDVYDALTTKRVYKEAFSHEESFAIIVEGCGTQFDPAIVDAFIKREKDFAKLAKSMVDKLPSPRVAQIRRFADAAVTVSASTSLASPARRAVRPRAAAGWPVVIASHSVSPPRAA